MIKTIETDSFFGHRSQKIRLKKRIFLIISLTVTLQHFLCDSFISYSFFITFDRNVSWDFLLVHLLTAILTTCFLYQMLTTRQEMMITLFIPWFMGIESLTNTVQTIYWFKFLFLLTKRGSLQNKLKWFLQFFLLTQVFWFVGFLRFCLLRSNFIWTARRTFIFSCFFENFF